MVPIKYGFVFRLFRITSIGFAASTAAATAATAGAAFATLIYSFISFWTATERQFLTKALSSVKGHSDKKRVPVLP